MAKLKTQGSRLYFISPTTNAVVEVACVQSISGLDASAEQVETTCLSSTTREYEQGLITPSTASLGLQFDPTSASHVELAQLHASGTKVDWCIGLADGTVAPTLDSDGDFVLGAARSWLVFNGYVSSFSWDLNVGSVVTNTVAIQMSSLATIVPKTP